jgi:hypothetical protein
VSVGFSLLPNNQNIRETKGKETPSHPALCAFIVFTRKIRINIVLLQTANTFITPEYYEKEKLFNILL